MYIIVHDNSCFNVDNDLDLSRLLKKGARKLTVEEIEQYGMKGYENQVSSNNTVVHEDGSITFTPTIETQEQKEANIRMIRNQYLLDTDKYVTVPDFPISESTKSQYIEYRQYLRDYPTTEDWFESNPKTFEEYIGD